MIPIQNIDREAPKAQIQIDNKTNYINGKIKAIVTLTDEESGVDFENSKWVITKTNTEIGENPELYTGRNNSK